MFHRIRASVVVPDGERILLVEAHALETRPSVGGMTGRYWNFPGGGLEEDESVLEGAERELREETGLSATAERVIYVHEVVHRLAPPDARERPIRQIELYVLMQDIRGDITLTDPDVLAARFMTRAEIARIPAYPPMLADLFWKDMADGFQETRFLGTHYVG